MEEGDPVPVSQAVTECNGEQTISSGKLKAADVEVSISWIEMEEVVVDDPSLVLRQTVDSHAACKVCV